MRSLIVTTLILAGLNANAVKMQSDSTDIYLDGEGKQISAVEAYRSEDPVFHCTKKEVKYNKRTGKPSMKKVD